MEEWGAAMGAEQKLKGTNVMLGPDVNLARVRSALRTRAAPHADRSTRGQLHTRRELLHKMRQPTDHQRNLRPQQPSLQLLSLRRRNLRPRRERRCQTCRSGAAAQPNSWQLLSLHQLPSLKRQNLRSRKRSLRLIRRERRRQTCPSDAAAQPRSCMSRRALADKSLRRHSRRPTGSRP